MSQIEIQILHQDYLLTCPDGHEPQLMEAVERVDQQFQQMRDNSKLRSRERVGVLLAVNLAYENLELRNQLQELQQQLAVLQGTSLRTEPEVDQDTLRLQNLELQAAQDWEAATRLLHRLDQVLAAGTASPAAAHSLAETHAGSTDAAPAAARETEIASTAFDIDNHVDLEPSSSKNL